MNDTDLTPTTLEPAITPTFLAQLEQMARQLHTAEQPHLSWATFLFSALRRSTSCLAPQLRLADISPV